VGPLLARLAKGDVLVVAQLDRASRNAADALATAEQLKARKVDLIVADMGSEPVRGKLKIRVKSGHKPNSCRNRMASGKVDLCGH
jgi:DNA invertase Pin-like site-specific DNA recombinase